MDGEERRRNLLRLLGRRGPWTVAGLAREVDASRRTVLRDIARLRERGYTLSADSGPGGGVQLDPGSVLPDAQLRADEVVALILAVTVSRAMPSVPFSGGAEAALARIERSLPAQRVRELRRLFTRILIGKPIPAGAVAGTGSIDPGLLAAFERAFRDSVVLSFRYVDRHGNKTFRRAEPHGMLLRAPVWYVIAWDREKDAARLFRMDRIRNPTVTTDRFDPRPQELVTGTCPDGVAM